MSKITNTVLLAQIRKLDERMMAQFEYLIREIHRIEDGRPREPNRPVVVSQAPDPGTPADRL